MNNNNNNRNKKIITFKENDTFKTVLNKIK